MGLQIASEENAAASRGSTSRPSSTSDVSANSSPASFASTPEALAAPKLSTDMKIDKQHQVYYAVINDRTGDELFEIPPEALREIGEGLNIPLAGDSSAHGIDLKS
jgi:hypothetical protein